MRKIDLKQFDEVYTFFQQAFIPAELRDYDEMKMLFEKGLFVIYGEYEDDYLLAAMIVWELEHCVYLENFAVSEKARGKGIGSFVLKEFTRLYKDCFLFMEVEVPYDSISRRRIQFYEKNGYLSNRYTYIQPPFRKDDEPVHLTFMTYPSCMNEEQCHDIKEEIFKVVYQRGKI